MNRQILVAGELSATFTALPEEDLVHDTLYARRLSGTMKIAQAIRKLDISCAVAGKIFTDPLGRSLLEELNTWNTDLSGLVFCDGHTAFSICTSNGQTEAFCPSTHGSVPSPEVQLPSSCITVFDADSLQDSVCAALYDRAAQAARETGAPLILCCLGHVFSPTERQASQAQIIYLDSAASAPIPSPAALLRGNTQAVLAVNHEDISLTTPHGTQKFSNFETTPCNESALGAAALAWLLYEYDITSDSLPTLLEEPSFIQELVRSVRSAWHTPSTHLEKLHTALHVSQHGQQLLSIVQRQMEASAPLVARSKWRLQYHIAAPSGWINDPNGLIQMNGTYHVFYQLHPFSPEWGPMYWGHATSRDLAYWTHEPIALAPDQPYEAGCFSGSAVNDNGVLTVLYTAHNDGNRVKECQCIARSCDGGKTFQKSAANPVIAKYPTDGSPDFRDPKVWRQDGRWQMVVGTSKHKKGRALLYSSDDLEHWDYRGVMCESDGTQGHMWECPNFCIIDGQDVLIYSPMGMKGHKNVYSVGHFDCSTGKFLAEGCRELDYGTNYYAAQVFEDEAGRTILIAWMDIWGTDFPTQEDGWAGALTLPRVLRMRGTDLLQQPVPELAALRKGSLLHSDFIVQGGENPLHDITGDCLEMLFFFRRTTAGQGFELELMLDPSTGRSARIVYNGASNAFAFPHGLFCSGEKLHADFVPCRDDIDVVDVHIFIDRCSIEVFIDEGAICFTQRVYPSESGRHYKLSASGLSISSFDVWLLDNAFHAHKEENV